MARSSYSRQLSLIVIYLVYEFGLSKGVGVYSYRQK